MSWPFPLSERAQEYLTQAGIPKRLFPKLIYTLKPMLKCPKNDGFMTGDDFNGLDEYIDHVRKLHVATRFDPRFKHGLR